MKFNQIIGTVGLVMLFGTRIAFADDALSGTYVYDILKEPISSPFANMDIVGLKLGSSEEQVEATLKGGGYALKQVTRSKVVDVPDVINGVTLTVPHNVFNATQLWTLQNGKTLDTISVIYCSPIVGNVLCQINRSVKYLSDRSGEAVFQQTIFQKYGRPAKALQQIRPTDNGGIVYNGYAYEYAEKTDKSLGSFEVIYHTESSAVSEATLSMADMFRLDVDNQRRHASAASVQNATKAERDKSGAAPKL